MLQLLQKLTPRLFTKGPWASPGTALLLAGAVAIVYANSFPGIFLLDDVFIAQHNPLVENPDLLTIFRSDYWHTVENSGLYRPLTILSLGLNRWLFGPQVWGFHLVNVLLHGATSILLWRGMLRWGLTPLASALAAFLFALHPLHADVLNTVVGRSELLVGFFLVLAINFARSEKGWHQAATCFCFLAALLSKEHAITFLALLPICQSYRETIRGALRRHGALYAGLLVTALSWLVWRKFGIVNPLPAFSVTEAAAPLAFVDTPTRILTALVFQGYYLLKLIFPYSLQTVYAVADLPRFVDTILSWSGLAVMAGVIAVGGGLAFGWRRRSLPALLALLYFVSFTPTSNLLFPIGVSFAERLAYFPSLWFCAFLAVVIDQLARRSGPRFMLIPLASCYLILFSVLLIARNHDYRDNLAVWKAEIDNNPNDFMAWQTYGETLNSLQRYEEAEHAFSVMLQLAPEYPAGLRTVTSFYSERNQYAAAEPTAVRAFELAIRSADPMRIAFDGLDLADVDLGLGRCADALELLNGPVWPLREQMRVLEIRGGALACLGREEAAAAAFVQITEDLPGHRVRYLHGLVFFRLGRFAEAREQLLRAVKQSPEAEAWNLLGVVSAQLEDWTAAADAFQQAVTLDPENVHYQENLARARGRRP